MSLPPRKRPADDIATVDDLLRLTGAQDLESLSDWVDEQVDGDGWVELFETSTAKRLEDVQDGEELSFRVGSRGVGIAFPYSLRDLQEAIAELDNE